MNYYKNPVATLKNRKMELQIKELPARLGRNNDAVKIYLFHESVSREHCLFECIDHKFTVMDLGSTFGTSVNGVKLEPNVRYHIEDGAKIQFGKVKMVFHADYQALAERENMQSQPVQNTPAVSDAPAVPDGPAEKKVISASVRELNSFEYDEDEVVYIECELKPENAPLSYTGEIMKKEPEEEEFIDEGTVKIEDLNAEEEIAGKTLYLTWVDDISGETRELTIDHFPFAIGRKSDENDYSISRKGISRKHLRFEEVDGEIYVYDDASTNGVRLNGEKIAPETMVKLSSGDTIRIMNITFEVKID